MKEKQVKITSHTLDFSTKLNLEGETYLIDSEDFGIKNPHIITRAYKKGMIVYSDKINYKDILNKPDFDKRFIILIQSQQQKAIEALKEEKGVPEKLLKEKDIKEQKEIVTQKKPYKEYVNELEALISKNIQEEALELLTEAMEHYPHNPIILSYCGYIEALVNKQYADGIKICRQSFKILKEQMSLGEGFFLPVLYLNLGRTYLTANKKKEAYYAFQKGLDSDKKNEDLFKELKKLGIRRKPFFPFLKRSNPLNRYIGMLTYDLQKKKFRP
jgi:tetratricopeptide (TPR) repeat protein